MNDYPALIKERLTAIIKEIAESPELYVKNPGKTLPANENFHSIQ